jgi:hypothetical protein
LTRMAERAIYNWIDFFLQRDILVIAGILRRTVQTQTVAAARALGNIYGPGHVLEGGSGSTT